MFHRVLLLFISILCTLFIHARAKVIKNSKADVRVATELPKLNNQIIAFNQSETILVPNTTQTVFREMITNKGRGHLNKPKRILKHLYPILMAALFAKLVVVPLVLKLLIATTSSAFVMSKIALVISALIALSWLLGANRERAKLQIVQYPGPSGLKKTFGGWNVQEKYSPQYGPYNTWAYDDTMVDNNDKNFFL